MQPQPSNGKASRGFTVMIMGAPGQQPRRLYVPHWAFAALFGAWIALMLGVAWFGFQSSESRSAKQDGVQPALNQGSTGASAGLSASASGKSAFKSAPVSSPASRQ